MANCHAAARPPRSKCSGPKPCSPWIAGRADPPCRIREPPPSAACRSAPWNGCGRGECAVLQRRPRLTPPVEPKVTGEVEAMIVKIACSEAPADAARWTMRLIADRLVELELVESISSETVRLTLKKTISSPGGRKAGASRRRRMPRS
ncbi:MAG: helix-turn-helix domain-containing protein [Verrucomicrobiales bacterium]